GSTSLQHYLFHLREDSTIEQAKCEAIPIGHFIEPFDVAHVVLFRAESASALNNVIENLIDGAHCVQRLTMKNVIIVPYADEWREYLILVIREPCTLTNYKWSINLP
ncbi:NAD(P)-binding protein, partial [Penicillium frequentans]